MSIQATPAASATPASVADRIERILAERIISGVLKPGERLKQDHLAGEFAASHVPVREAFRKLEAQGLLVSKPRCGVRVTHIDPAMVIEVTEMRAALEGLALQHAVPRLHRNDIAVAEQALIDGESSGEIGDWEAANRRFHLALLTPCAMPRLLGTIGDLHRSDARFLFATWRELAWQPRSAAEHRAILEAVKRGEMGHARQLLERHIREAGNALVGRLRALHNEETAA